MSLSSAFGSSPDFIFVRFLARITTITPVLGVYFFKTYLTEFHFSTLHR